MLISSSLISKGKYACCFFFISLIYFSAQKAFSQNKIFVKIQNNQYAIAPNVDESHLLSELRKGMTNDFYYTTLVFEKLPNTHAINLLRKNNIEILEILSDNLISVRASSAPSVFLLRSAGVKAIKYWSPEFKMNESLIEQLSQTSVDSKIEISLLLYRGVSVSKAKEELGQLGFLNINNKYSSEGLLIGTIKRSQLNEIASKPYVKFINTYQRNIQPLLQFEKGAFGLSSLVSTASNGRSLSGRGITLGVGDDADPTAHPDLQSDVVNRNPALLQASEHGTRVSGIISGDGIVDERYVGVAPDTRLITDNYDYIITKSAVYKQDFNMSLTNNSYYNGYAGCAGNSDYDELSVYIDEQLYNDPYLQHIFASGNDGSQICGPYPKSFATIKSGYQTAKNVLTVGNYYIYDQAPRISPSSSRGPVKDGRIKPEIITSGSNFWTTSLRSTFYTNAFGTSYASPMVAGVWSLLSERYKQLHADTLPKSGLLKAILCNSASDRGVPGPDYTHGFGLVHPLRALNMLESNRYIAASVNNGSKINFTIPLPDGIKSAKILLYWHDPAGSPLANKALQHDLDLSVLVNGTTYLPWILDPAVDKFSNAAIRGVDRLNNIEQVTIDNPTGNAIQVEVNGFSIIAGQQEFFLTWEFAKDTLNITHPIGGEKFTVASTAEPISWDALDFTNDSLKIEYSIDNGLTWNLIVNKFPANQYWYFWGVPNISSSQAKIKLTSLMTGRESITPGTFTIIGRSTLNSVVPCDGAVNLSWSSVANASDYEVLQLINNTWTRIATTPALQHAVRGLDKNSRYWFSVRARISDSTGRRFRAVSVNPSLNTPCTSNEFNNDLAVDQLVAPKNGRKFTTSQLKSAQEITVKIKNLNDSITSGTYEIMYQVNGGEIIMEESGLPIPPGGTIDYTFIQKADLSSSDSFFIKVTVKQNGDLSQQNNEQTFLVRHIDNEPVLLPHLDNFESTGIDEYMKSAFGMRKIDRYDYFANTNNGRLRTFVNTGMALDGNRAITMDAAQFIGAVNVNELTGTYNLSNVPLKEGLRFDLMYKNQGQLKLPNTTIFVRGKDDLSWIKALELSNSQNALDKIRRGWINLYEVLTGSGQPLTSSFQVMIQQTGRTSSNNSQYYPEAFDLDDGITIDNIRISNATNDLALIGVTSPDSLSCSNDLNQQSLSIRVRNTTSNALTNVPVYYRVDKGTSVTENIPFIAANSEIVYTFTLPITFSGYGTKSIDTWLSFPGDNYSYNDSISGYTIVNTSRVQTFPYLENFEVNDGKWFTTSPYSSWIWGETDPNTRQVLNTSANGNKAWFTSLGGSYNSNENSYLYSPCFNLSTLSNPILSFSHIYQLETGRDFHFVEYTTNNGLTWQTLGLQNAGTNWYDTTTLVWRNNIQRWHVSSIDLPKGLTNIQFRFLISSDDFNQGEGIGLDDFHIFDKRTIYEGVNAGLSLPVSGNNFIDFTSQGKLIASINPLGQNLGNLNVNLFINTDSVRLLNNQYYLDRNLVISPQFNPADSVIVRVYFTENEIRKMISTTKCTSCIKLNDAYKASITRYAGPAEFENGILNDGSGGSYEYIPASMVQVIPYNNGYYAEFKTKSFSEFWIHAANFNLSQPTSTSNDPLNPERFIVNSILDNSGNLTIVAGANPFVKDINIRLINANGQEVAKLNKPYQSGTVSLPYLSSGVYFISITERTGRYQYSRKLIKP